MMDTTRQGSSSDEMQPFVVNSNRNNYYSHRSIETLVVVIAVITIVGVIAGMIARLCGGRHFNGDNDIEGWVDNKCRSCIDAGLPPPPPPPQEPQPPKPAPTTAADAGSNS
ncbi:hypothetical protein PIB30_083805 [Stylosanthes scabra]|uniref:Uncharacterized protein n=1 Tax=Stylosanthes scabra TaxID=79078 RepID=A0ABU6TRV5_9FABA|nr:hypothetical protein [Stylosanthes scabra]